jgi:hypothetical protein
MTESQISAAQDYRPTPSPVFSALIAPVYTHKYKLRCPSLHFRREDDSSPAKFVPSYTFSMAVIVGVAKFMTTCLGSSLDYYYLQSPTIPVPYLLVHVQSAAVERVGCL